MTTNILLLTLGSGLLSSFAPLLFQKQGNAPGRQLSLQFWRNVFQTTLAGTAMLTFGLRFGGMSYIGVCIGSSLFMTVNNYLYFSVATHRGPVSISWAVVYMSSALVGIMGWLFLQEPVRFYQPPGLVCFAACLAVMGWASYRTARKRGTTQPVQKGYWASTTISLAAASIGAFGMKYKNMVPDVGDDVAYLFFRSLVMGAVMAIVLVVTRTRPLTDRRTMLYSAVSALVFLGTFFLLLKALVNGAASVIFPIQAGSAVLFGVLWAILRGERPSRLAYLGVFLAILSIVLIGLGGRVLWTFAGN